MAPQRFTATLEERWFVVPVDARELWGEARPPVSGTIDGHPFRGRLAVYGGETVLGLTNAYRAEVGIVPGDRIEVVMDRDDGRARWRFRPRCRPCSTATRWRGPPTRSSRSRTGASTRSGSPRPSGRRPAPGGPPARGEMLRAGEKTPG